MADYLRGSGSGTSSGAADLDALIHSMPDAVYVGDERGVSACNDAALLMLGCEDLVELDGGLSVLFERLQHRFPETGERVPPPEEPFSRALGGETVVEERSSHGTGVAHRRIRPQARSRERQTLPRAGQIPRGAEPRDVPRPPHTTQCGGGSPPHPLGQKDPELSRILQEALANTRRHSGAENVSVSLGVEGGRTWAEVEDDGRASCLWRIMPPSGTPPPRYSSASRASRSWDTRDPSPKRAR